MSMPVGAPDGVHPPVLQGATSDSITVIWEGPGRVNGPDPPGVVYQLQFRVTGSTQPAENLYDQPTSEC